MKHVFQKALRNTSLWLGLGFVLCLAGVWFVGQRASPLPDAQAAQDEQPYVAMAKGKIDIEGGLIKLAARRDGIIRSVAVEEGEFVRQGQILASLEDGLARIQLERARREKALKEAAIQTQRSRIAAEERLLARLIDAGGSVTARQVEESRDRLVTARAELHVTERDLAIAEIECTARNYEVEQHRVRAPLDGQIVRRQARPGDGTSTLNVTSLFLFAPEAPRIVRAELDERYLGKVMPGMNAEVLLEADEKRVFTARVLRLGKVVGQRGASDDPAERQDVRVVECVLELKAPELLIGQRVLVKIKA